VFLLFEEPYLRPLDPLGQRLRTPAERASMAALYPWSLDMTRSARKPVAAFGETTPVDADERALFCPGQLFFIALNGTS
jgi:hypothetical protein